MLIDRWDIAHICVTVDDLEAGMARYTDAYGLRWGPIMTFCREGLRVSPTEVIRMESVVPEPGQTLSMEGLREVWAVNAGPHGVEGESVPALQLSTAAPSSPAFPLWGCPTGTEFVHHVSYWVDDLQAEAAHLTERGYTIEFPLPKAGVVNREFVYLLSPFGMRIELAHRRSKSVIAQWFVSDDRKTVGR